MSRFFRRMAASATIALAAAGPLLVPSGMAAPVAASSEKEDAALVVAVKDALTASLGADASDVVVTARNGRVTLHGWVDMPRQEAQARTIAGKVPGVKKAYSNIRTWSSKDEN
jgi:osmotically-inducible protein OsmY